MTTYMKEARRAPGSEWIKDHPRPLDTAYRLTRRLVERFYPLVRRLNPRAAERAMAAGERLAKGYLFNCMMCGQCILHSTGMTCPMNCPKKLRNGPCGGVRANGNCEVIAEMPCVWVQAYQRSRRSGYADEMLLLQPPVDHRLWDTSSWANMVEGRDTERPLGWDVAAAPGEADAVGGER